MANLVVHFEIHASEPQLLIDFYAELFGWTFTQFGDMPYWAIDTGEGAIGMNTPGSGINGGLTQRQGPAPERGAPSTAAISSSASTAASMSCSRRDSTSAAPRRCHWRTCRASAGWATCSIPTATCSGSSRRSFPTAPM